MIQRPNFCPATWLRCYRECQKECRVKRERRETPHVVMATLTYPTGSLGEVAESQEVCEARARAADIHADLMARYGTTKVWC